MSQSSITKITSLLDSNFKIEDIGTIDKKISKKIESYKTNFKDFNSVIIFYKADNSIDKINFVSQNFLISLEDLIHHFGNFESGYSFRDDITKFSFSPSFKKIKKITTKMDSRCEIKEDKMFIYTVKGETTESNCSDNNFKSICFHF